MVEGVDGGWSFEEALARTSDPRLWDRCQAEKRQQTAASADLRRSLVPELLAKIGTKLFAAVPRPTPSADRWIALDRAALEKKVANERINEVRFFPPLKAPFAAEYLKGQSLAEAFQRYVINDPEVVALIERTGTRDRFEGGTCPLGLCDFHWPLETRVSDFEYRLTEGSILQFGGPERRPTAHVSALSGALVDRIEALRGLLVSGKIQAFGLSIHFVESPVPARLWARKNVSIDLANGDLCEEDDRGHFSPILTSVELRSSKPVFQGEEPASQPKMARNRSAKGQEVRCIIKEHEIDVGALGRKAAASEVMPHMKKPPTSEIEKKALETMVARIWQEMVSMAR